MNYNSTETIIQRIQPQCDALPQRMKDAKNAQRKTNQSVADSTGVPLSTVAKFFSGTLSNPSVFGVAAMCIDLDLSLDNLMGITQEQPEENRSHIMELELKLESSEAQVALLKERSRILEAGINERKPLILGLLGLCCFLFAAFTVYLMMDIGNFSFGFIRDNEHVSPALILLGFLAVAMVWSTVQVAIKYKAKKQNTKKDDEIESK